MAHDKTMEMECAKCGWLGSKEDLGQRESKMMKEIGVICSVDVCPVCGHDEFYILTE